jgi:hypothetical protein
MASGKDKINEAGVLLIKLVHKIKQDQSPHNFKDSKKTAKDKNLECIRKTINKVNGILQDVNPEIDLHKYAALQSALRIFDLLNNDDATFVGNIKVFKTLEAAITGGPEAATFGGRRIGKKLTSDEYYLRAAAVVLWKFYNKHKHTDAVDQLISDARTIIKIGSKKKLAKLVDNFEQSHDIMLKNSKSPLSPHIKGIEDLVNNHGYLRLKDFI